MADDLLDLFSLPSQPQNVPTQTRANKSTLSKEDIQSGMSEHDGSGTGILTVKQCLAAMLDLPNLGMTEEECKVFIQSATETCGDNGKIKLEPFAAYLANELNKKQNTNHGQNGHGMKPPVGIQISVEYGSETSPSPRERDTVLSPTDPLAAVSLPEWYGHSLHSPVVDNGNTNDVDLWGFDDQTAKKITGQPIIEFLNL